MAPAITSRLSPPFATIPRKRNILALALVPGAALAQPPGPPYETKKLTDSAYIFRYMGAQSMFVVTPDGVIATDPMNLVAAKVYVSEIRKVTGGPRCTSPRSGTPTR